MKDLNGFLIIDKPEGLSSFQVIRKLRKILNIKKAGHTGTLDPFASGLLVVALQSATRLIQFLEESVKVYRTQFRLGLETDTNDCTGKVINESSTDNISESLVKEVLNQFRGEILQLPPKFSAKKIKGKSAYKYARQGRDINLIPVPVNIINLELEEFNNPYLTLTITCSRGTYVRALARDIGKELGVGGTVETLRRTASGNFNLTQAIGLDQLNKTSVIDHLISPGNALSNLKRLDLKSEYTYNILNGVQPQVNWFTSPPVEEGVYQVLLEHNLVILEYQESILRYLRVVKI